MQSSGKAGDLAPHVIYRKNDLVNKEPIRLKSDIGFFITSYFYNYCLAYN